MNPMHPDHYAQALHDRRDALTRLVGPTPHHAGWRTHVGTLLVRAGNALRATGRRLEGSARSAPAMAPGDGC